jgi:hypothetical protein
MELNKSLYVMLIVHHRYRVLYEDWQLVDLKHFCASTAFGTNILGVDPTFDCGDFDLTVTTYPHPLLESK